MKTKSILSFACFSFLYMLTLVGCSEDKTTLIPDPTLSVSEKSLAFGYEENRQEVTVTTNQSKWFVAMDTKDKEWCIVYSSDNKISIRVATNPKEEKREAKILIVVAGTLTDSIHVSQEAAPPIPILTVSGEANFTFEETTNIMSVITNQNDWTASIDANSRDWCTLVENKTDQTLTIRVNENPGEKRTAIVTVTAGIATPVVFEVSQESQNAAEAIGVDVPDFKNSFIYSVLSEGEKIAEICQEFIKEVSTTKRTRVAYPYVDGKVDLSKGFIVDNGGRISWNKNTNTYQYTPGSLTPTSKLYISESVIRGSGLASKTATTEAEKLTDIEGKSYKLVKVGMQYWMAENLKTVTYNDNTSIPGLIGIASQTGGYLIYEDTRISADKEYRGCLYNYYALSKLAPKGWHVPDVTEWNKLNNYLFGTSGVLLNETGWRGETFSNATGFSAIPSGYCFESGKCSLGDSQSIWWSSTENENNSKQGYYETVDILGKSSTTYFDKSSGYAVRLLRD